MNKVVVRTREGDIYKGFTGDFSRQKPSFLLSSNDGTVRTNQIIELKNLKAIFFVKSLEGNFLNREKAIDIDKENSTGYGIKVIVSFKDGEEFLGRIESRHSNPEDAGFFIFPQDADSNIIRAFVLNDAIIGIQVYK